MNQPQTGVSSDQQNPVSSAKTVVVVGAGLSGLIAARSLSSDGHQVIVLDQARAPGGRLATKQAGQATFDHGAQFFTTRSDEFKAAVSNWCEDDLVSEWCTGFETSDGYARYKATGGMSQLAKSLAEPLDVRLRSQVGSIIPQSQDWAVSFNVPELAPVHADAVVLACPVPLALTMLSNGGANLLNDAREKAQAIRYHRVIAAMVQTRKAPDLGPVGAQQQPDEPFSFIADNQLKGISSAPATTFHLSHEASEALWKTKDKKLQAELAGPLASVLGDQTITGFAIKRWHHAGPVQAIEDRALLIATSPRAAILCGDAFGGPKIEGAFLSGLAAAKMASQQLSS